MIKCPACESLETKTEIFIENYPISIFPHSNEEAMRMPVHSILVYRCNNCKHNFLENKSHLDYIYNNAYINYPHQHSSETFSYREEFADFFVNFKQIEIEELLEIGSNSFNNLLEFSGIAGGVTGISLEATPKQSQNIELIQGSFDSLNFDKKFTIILSRFVLEHIYDLKSHLNKVFDILNISGYFIVQVPNPSKMLSNNVFNVLAHEHLHYFTECSLRTLFAQNGFEIIELLNGNSFLVCAKKSEQLENSSIAKINSTDINSVLFDQDVFKNLGEYIQSEIYSSRKVVIYGAGLNLIGLFLVNPALRVNPNIQIVDDNYLIIGKFMPNSSIEIIRLDQTQINKNSIIIILANSTYQDLIVDRIKKLGLHNKVFNANLVELNLHN
jgi:hypothetical protein